MKKTVAILCLMVLFLSGCKQTTTQLTALQAEEIALSAMGFTREQVPDVRTHVGEYADKDCFSIMFTIGQKDYEFVIDAHTGEIIKEVS